MKSSYRIFRIFGISIELHITFILLLLILFTVGWLGESFIAGLQLVLLFILLFTIVVAHEISHSVVALMWKIKDSAAKRFRYSLSNVLVNSMLLSSFKLEMSLLSM